MRRVVWCSLTWSAATRATRFSAPIRRPRRRCSRCPCRARVADDIGDVPTGDEAVTRAGFRGIALKATAKQPDRPLPAPAAESVPLTDTVTARLVNHYLRQIADPSFRPTRGIALVSRTAGAEPKPSGPEVLGDALLPLALRDKIRASGAKRVVLIPDGALHKLPFEALLLSADASPKYALDELPAVCYAPSLTVLAVVLNRPRANDGPASLLTVGDPAYAAVAVGPLQSGGALPQLPYTATESKNVRQFFAPERVTALERGDATEAKVTAALPGKAVRPPRRARLRRRCLRQRVRGHRPHAPGAQRRRFQQRRLLNAARDFATEVDRVRTDGVERLRHQRRPAAPARSGCHARGCLPRRRVARGDGKLLVGGRPRHRGDDDRVLTARCGRRRAPAFRPPESLRNARLAVRGKAGWEAPVLLGTLRLCRPTGLKSGFCANRRAHQPRGDREYEGHRREAVEEWRGVAAVLFARDRE